MSKRLTNLTINKNLNLRSTFEITALSRNTVKTHITRDFLVFKIHRLTHLKTKCQALTIIAAAFKLPSTPPLPQLQPV